jgi:hypothetical protein
MGEGSWVKHHLSNHEYTIPDVVQAGLVQDNANEEVSHLRGKLWMGLDKLLHFWNIYCFSAIEKDKNA